MDKFDGGADLELQGEDSNGPGLSSRDLTHDISTSFETHPRLAYQGRRPRHPVPKTTGEY